MLRHEPAKITVLICVLVTSVALIALAGCSSVEMKGTPFYTGEYEEREGPVEDRVNVWPLVYYSDPALSILWPFIELTDDHFAIRPVYSVYGLDKEKQIHSVLWPIAEFDGQEQANRIFPFFWWGEDAAGDDYATVFPLYWHRGDPYGGDGGLDTLFPLWWYNRDDRDFSLYFLWPFINVMRRGDQEGWHVWPLAGSRESDDGYRRYAFWPLMHQWRSKENEKSGHSIIPLYVRSSDKNTSGFYSLPWSIEHKANGDFWQFAPPLFYRAKDEDGSRFYSLPWSARTKSDNEYWRFVPPLFYWGEDRGRSAAIMLLWGQGASEREKSSWHALAPFYFYEKSEDERLLATPLGIHKTSGEERDWMFFPLLASGKRRKDSGSTSYLGGLIHREWSGTDRKRRLFPLYTYEKTGDRSSLILYPLLSGGESGEDDGSWLAAPLLSGGSWDNESRETTLLAGLLYDWRGPDSRSHHALPFYRYSRDKSGSQFLSLPYSQGKGSDGSSWRLTPPIFYWDKDTDGDRLLTPVWSHGRSTKDGSSWQALLPLFFRAKAEDGIEFVTLAGRYKRQGEASSLFFVPFLSGGDRDTEKGTGSWFVMPALAGGTWSRTDGFAVALGGLLNMRWDESSRSHAVLPFYDYTSSDERTRLLVPPLLSSVEWKEDESSWTFLPLLASGGRGDGGSRFKMLGGMIDGRRSESARSHQFLPFYRYSRDETGSVFLSLPLSLGSGADGASWQFAPPLFYHAKDAKGERFISPIFAGGSSADDDASWHAVIPFYLRRRSNDETLVATLLGGWATDAKGHSWLVYPLLSGGAGDENGGSVWVLAPLIHAEWDDDSSSHHALPLYYWDGREKTFISPLALQWRGADATKTTLVVPALSWLSETEQRSDLWLAGPLGHFSWGEEAGSQHLLPLFYGNAETGTFVSSVWSKWQNEDETRTYACPPLASWLTTGDRRSDLWLAGAMAHWSWGKESGPRHVAPFFYDNERTGTFLSGAVSWWQNSDGTTSYICPPVASWLTTGERRSDLWLAGPVGHFSWGEDASGQHLLPLFYGNVETGTFVSSVAAKWRNDDGSRTYLCPPALSWLTAGDDRSDLWLLGPLAHTSWGDQAGSTHCFPLFYDDPNTGTFLSAPLCTWRSGSERHWLVPPLLSAFSTDGERKELVAAMGLFQQNWGCPPEEKRGRLLPLYTYEGRHFYTPLFGWNNSEDGFAYLLTPLLGIRKGDHSGSWLWPLYTHKRTKATGNYKGGVLWGDYWKTGDRGGSHLLPFYNYSNLGAVDSDLPQGTEHAEYGTELFCLPLCWFSNKSYVNAARDGTISREYVRKTRIFPFYNSSERRLPQEKKLQAESSLLWWLYDTKRMIRPADEEKDEEAVDYTRRRVLWRLWHYEKLNGDVSVDVFPAITYDTKKNGFKKISFLWRFFRYEKDPEEGTKLDLFFIPFSWGQPEAAAK